MRPSPSARRKNQIEVWFSDNLEALSFVEDWLELKEKGKTAWGAKSVMGALREHYQFPFVSETSLINWVKVYRPASYARAIQRES